MRRLLILIPAVGMGLLLTGFWFMGSISAGAEPAKPSGWDYKVEELGPGKGASDAAKIEKVLNEMGKDGWELAQPVPYSDANGAKQLLLVFKRPKPRP